MKNPSLTAIAGRSFPELAAAVRATCDQVLAEWIDSVKDLLHASENLTYAEIRNNIPRTLEQLAVALASDDAADTRDLLSKSLDHGICRFHQHFNLNEVLIEYARLRQLLLAAVTRQLGRGLDVPEIVAINAGLDASMRRSVIAFVNHQKHELQAATDAQSKYLSFLSHDLRGGLNGVLLMMEVLKRELSSQPALSGSLEDLDMMRRSILETTGTMDRFLHAERFRRGKVQIKPSPIQLRHLIVDIVSQFTYQATDKGMTIQTEVSHEQTIESDRELISMILQNLMSNAIKYGPRGTVVLHVSKPPAESTAAVRISISDQGPGIAPEKLSQLFTSFTRGETHGQPGVGLGLSIARQAAEQLGARLWAESELGHGTTFHVELPEKISPGT